jgi:major facilitator superfamily permease
VLAALVKFQDADTSSLTPALVNQLPTALHDAVASSYADALLPIFGWMIPLFVVTAVIGLFLPEVPLSRKTGMEQVAEAESAETAETAEAESAGSAEAEAESVSSQ